MTPRVVESSHICISMFNVQCDTRSGLKVKAQKSLFFKNVHCSYVKKPAVPQFRRSESKGLISSGQPGASGQLILIISWECAK